MVDFTNTKDPYSMHDGQLCHNDQHQRRKVNDQQDEVVVGVMGAQQKPKLK